MTATRYRAAAILLTLFIVAAASRAPAQGRSRAPADPASLLLSRNIFDPTRSPRRAPERGPIAPPVAPPRVRMLVLTGSLVYPGKAVAFFSGSEPEYNRVIGPEETVGPWTVRKVSTTGVELAREDEVVDLPVGRQLVQREAEPWALADAAAPQPAPPSYRSPSSPTRGRNPETPAAGDGGDSDVMRRLMERRQRELSR